MLASATAVGEFGFNLGVKRNSDSQCKETSDYENDFDHLSGTTDTIKVYAVSDCNTLQNLSPALESKGFKAFLGVWPNDDAHYQAEKAALSAYLPNLSPSNVRGILVGSEALYRGDLSASELADKINDIKSLIQGITGKDGNSFSSVPVGTVDSWNMLIDGSAQPAVEASDLIMANAFSYWQGQALSNASFSFFDDIMQALQVIQTTKGSTDIDFWVGETGWPTAGETYKDAQPGVDNAATFWQEGICAIRGWGINTLIFEAYDETWKPDATADDGTDVSETERNWGVLNPDGSPKYDITCSF